MEITLKEIYSSSNPPTFKSYFSERDLIVFSFSDLKKTFSSIFNFIKGEFLHKLKAARAINFFEEELFDSGAIALKYEYDNLFLEKVQKYTLFPKYDVAIFPFDNTYQKLYLELSNFDKVAFKCRQKIEFLNSEPFQEDGLSHFFELSEMWRSENCSNYLNLITREVKRKFNVLERAFLKFNADIFEPCTKGGLAIIDSDAIRLGKLNKRLRRENMFEKGIPKVEIEYIEPPKTKEA